jgi:hypothetical protein
MPHPSGGAPVSILTGLSQPLRRRKPTVFERIVRYRLTFGQGESMTGSGDVTDGRARGDVIVNAAARAIMIPQTESSPPLSRVLNVGHHPPV